MHEFLNRSGVHPRETTVIDGPFEVRLWSARRIPSPAAALDAPSPVPKFMSAQLKAI
jgi:hypothetical protein